MKLIFKRSTVLVASFLATLAMVLGVASPQLAYAADAKTSACQGAAIVTGSTTANCGNQTNSNKSVNTLAQTIVNILSIVVGIVAVIMIIIAGFKFVTSGGDSNQVSSARNTILYAIVGLVIVAMAQLLVYFVINKV